MFFTTGLQSIILGQSVRWRLLHLATWLLLVLTTPQAFAVPLARFGVSVDKAVGANKTTTTAVADTANATLALGNGIPLRIMPLGASITWGQASTDGNGYRQALRQLLLAAGNPVNMVGSRHGGTMPDNGVEGWPGARVDEVHAKAAASVPRWRPNVVLVNAGTNDAGQNVNVTGCGRRMEAMLDAVYAASPRALVVLSTLVINLGAATERNAVAISKQYRALVTKLRRAGRSIVLAEMHDAQGPLSADMADRTHPNDAGYKKMAAIWYAALREASDAGMLQRPEAVDGVPDVGV